MYSSIKDKFGRFHSYESLPNNEESKDDVFLMSSRDTLLESEGSGTRSFRVRVFGKVCITLNLLLLTLNIFLLLILLPKRATPPLNQKPTLESSSFYSPIEERLTIPIETRRMNITFLDPTPQSIYRMPPSPLVDQEWDRLSNISPIPLSTHEVTNLGYNASETAKFPEEFNLGPDAHIARIDVFHQIHCLNALRKEANFDYYYSDKYPDRKTSAGHKLHINHCLHLLLQNVMCNANVDVFLHYWIDTLTEMGPYPDFSINHRCRDFEGVLRYQEENSVDLGYYGENVVAWRPEDVFRKDKDTLY